MLKSLFLIIVSFFFFVSCSDDNPVQTVDEDIELNYIRIAMPDGNVSFMDITSYKDPNDTIKNKKLYQNKITKFNNSKCILKINLSNEKQIESNNYISKNGFKYLRAVYETTYKNKNIKYYTDAYSLKGNNNIEHLEIKIVIEYDNNLYDFYENIDREIKDIYINNIKSLIIY